MATLTELAAAAELKKKPAPPEPSGTRLVLSTSGKGNSTPSGNRSSGARLTRPEPQTPSSGPQDRLLGTEQLADLIPMEWPQSQPAKTWNEARLSPAKNLGVILSQDQTRAWISLCAPGMTPLLLYALPVLGRLSTSPAELAALAAPCGNSPGNTPNESPSPASPPDSAPPAGSGTVAPFPSEPAPAQATLTFEQLHGLSRAAETARLES